MFDRTYANTLLQTAFEGEKEKNKILIKQNIIESHTLIDMQTNNEQT